MRAHILNRTIFLFLLLTGVWSSVWSKPGDSCSEPIVLTPEYEETIDAAGTRWYIANTFDLPLAIGFYPTNVNSAAPELYLDFSCEPGHYDDPILCGLFCSSNSAYISMPYKQIPSMSYDGQGRARYQVEFGEFYRDMLLRQGIDYNVPVYIRVVFSGGGTLTMEPDAFSACMDGPKFMHLGDTVQVQPNDKNRHVIVPYVQWQYDSIRYVWQGEQPCTFAVGNKCSFDPTGVDGVIIDQVTIQPGGMAKVSSELLMQYVSDQTNYPNDAGMYFAKFYSESAGVITIEKIPAPPPAGGATLLKYGTKTDVYSNDLTTVYAMPSSWVKAMQFSTPTDHVFRMYIGATADFTPENAFASYQFDKTDDGHLLSLFAEEMASIWTHKVSGENYLYVRFECTENTTILPMLWTPSDCILKAERIVPDVQFEVAGKSKVIYGLFYEDWRGGDMTIAWTSNQATCPFYIADTCDVPNSNEAPVFYTDKAPKRGSVVCHKETIDTWAQYVDPDGYIYIRFYPTAKGKITVSTTAPAEEDPLCDPYDSVLTVSAWDKYEWRGTVYNTSGTYSKDGQTDIETGCMDTLFTLHLTIHKTTYDSYQAVGCDSVLYQDKKYTVSGEYKDTTMTAQGDRVVTTVEVTIHHPSYSDTTAVVCSGLEWHGTRYETGGDYTFTTTNAEGCDSIRTLHLTVHTPVNTDTVEEAWDSLAWYGTTYTESGTYSIEKKDAHQCDYTHSLHLTIHHTLYDTVPLNECDSIIYQNKKYTAGGVYVVDTTILASGDRQVNCIRLSLRFSSSSEQTVRQYDPYLSVTGKKYTASGDYQDTIPNAAGCDSVITTHLTVYPTTYSSVTQTSCEDIVYNNKTYTESGTYTDTIVALDKSREIVTLNLTISHPYAITLPDAHACDKYVWGDTTILHSGTYTRSFRSVAGCDSIVTQTLTVGKTTYTTDMVTAYDSCKWIDGKTYYVSGGGPICYLTNATGCDSVVSLRLSIRHMTKDTVRDAVCSSELPYQWKGMKLTQEGFYTTDIIQGKETDMDTLHTIYLTVYPAYDIDTVVSLTGTWYEWRGEVYTESGAYLYETKTKDGCDSLVTLHLSLIQGEIRYDTVWYCEGFNTEHDARVDDNLVRRYRPYTYEAPGEWCLEGVVLEMEPDRILVDLQRAEENLYAYYTGGLEPVTAVTWSYQPYDAPGYEILERGEEPQWIARGVVAVQVHFLCGHTFRSDFASGRVQSLDPVTGEREAGKKVLVGGQLMILRNGERYNILGVKLH